MNYKLIQNNILKNQNMIIFSSTGVAGLSVMIYQGILNTALLFFGVILPLYQIINIVSTILPLKEKSMKKEQVLGLTQWNLILANHIILNFFANLVVFVNSFYIKIAQLVILYIMYKFGDSINTSFDNSEDVSDTSETNKNSIVLTDVLLVVNKNRVSFFNNLINNYLESFKNLNLNFDKGFIETVSSAMGTETNTPELVKDDDSVEETTVDE
jgi:hypothetical protein